MLKISPTLSLPLDAVTEKAGMVPGTGGWGNYVRHLLRMGVVEEEGGFLRVARLMYVNNFLRV